MTKPNDYSELLVHRQKGACAVSGDPIGPPLKEWISSVDVDHDVPLYRVARDHADEPWYELIRFWGTGNLRAITNAAHLSKNRREAADRAGRCPQAVMI